MNNVSLVGRLTKDPETKFIGDKNTAVCNFNIAVNRDFKNQDGEYEADFITCQAWGSTAEFMGSYLQKGQMIAVVGSIQTRTYEDKDKNTRYVTEINCKSVNSLEKRKETVSFKTVGEVKDAWTKEWDKRSVGLDADSKESLRKELTKKYQPIIDKLSDAPF